MYLFDRFKYKINDTGCWVVLSHRTCRDGYPRINYKRKNTPAHRYVYFTYVDKIPYGHVVRHTCDNRLCINPEHLLTGTIVDNVKDRELRGRTSYASRTTGETNGRAKLTKKDVIKIRSLRGSLSQPEIAKKYNIKQSYVSAIQLHKTWKHVTIFNGEQK